MRLFRILLVLFIALALPLQGFATAMMACASSHERLDVAPRDSAGHQASHRAGQHGADHHGARHHAGADHHGHALAEPVSSESSLAFAEAETAGKAFASANQMHDAAQQECSACAACCSLTTLPAPVLPDTALSLSETLVPTLFGPIVAFVTGGQERPPRQSLV